MNNEILVNLAVIVMAFGFVMLSTILLKIAFSIIFLCQRLAKMKKQLREMSSENLQLLAFYQYPSAMAFQPTHDQAIKELKRRSNRKKKTNET